MTLEIVALHLERIGELYRELGYEFYRANAFIRAASSVRDAPEDFGPGSEWQSLPSVGPATSEVIEEFLKRGTSSKYENLVKESCTSGEQSDFDLEKLKDFSKETINWMVRNLVYSKETMINLIKNGHPMPEEVILGAGYQPRERWEKLVSQLVCLFNSLDKEADCAGSLRRKSKYIRDVDIVCVSDYDSVVEIIRKSDLPVEIIGDGQIKVRIKLTDGENSIEGDLVLTTPECFGACLLYLTGPFQFNIRMRGIAKSKGLRLNEYALYDGSDPVAGETEESIFDELGMGFMEPDKRS